MRSRYLLASAAALALCGVVTSFDANGASAGNSKPAETFAASPKVIGDLVAATDAQGFYVMSVSDAQNYSDAGLAELNPDGPESDGQTIKVRASDAARKEIADSNEANAAATGKASFEVVRMAFPTNVNPERRSREGTYPFDELKAPEFGPDGKTIVNADSFFIAATEDKPNPERSYASTVSSAQARYNEVVRDGDGNPVMEEVTRKVRQKDGNGNDVKGPDGKFITQDVKEMREKTKPGRLFKILATQPDDPKGKGARVWRIA